MLRIKYSLLAEYLQGLFSTLDKALFMTDTVQHKAGECHLFPSSCPMSFVSATWCADANGVTRPHSRLTYDADFSRATTVFETDMTGEKNSELFDFSVKFHFLLF